MWQTTGSAGYKRLGHRSAVRERVVSKGEMRQRPWRWCLPTAYSSMMPGIAEQNAMSGSRPHERRVDALCTKAGR